MSNHNFKVGDLLVENHEQTGWKDYSHTVVDTNDTHVIVYDHELKREIQIAVSRVQRFIKNDSVTHHSCETQDE